MTIEDVKKAVYYYVGKKISDGEAKEILWYVNERGRDLAEVIAAYYSC